MTLQKPAGKSICPYESKFKKLVPCGIFAAEIIGDRLAHVGERLADAEIHAAARSRSCTRGSERTRANDRSSDLRDRDRSRDRR